ncbi:MAG: hypothetical protein EA378_05525 [Phycisphaerales bacterium]|nr:MAG: hypothetical protein EA378_05525 [Phycisphaerales bacterium]
MNRVQAVLLAIGLGVAPAAAFDPANGQWGKTEPTDVRVMTWNVADGICSSNFKNSNFNNWGAIVRTIAAIKPDVIIFQETADNSGNGTGSGMDSVAVLTTTFELLIGGGPDPFRPGDTVSQYIQAYDPDLDYPYIFIGGSAGDGFNRNAILSRFPFADINGDGKSTYITMPTIRFQDGPYPAGDGGIRGFVHAEIDLPDDVYAGDMVIGNSHLKCCGSQSDRNQRLVAAQNIAYYIYYMYAGAGTGTPDPTPTMFPNPPVTNILDENTVVIWGGDINEDELTNGRRGPVAWMTEGPSAGGNNGTDRDNSDSAHDDARCPFTNNRATFGSGSTKLDYLMWWDSVADVRNQFIFRSDTIPSGLYPPEILGFLSNRPELLTGIASDHRPVVVDYILPLVSIGEPPAVFDITAPAPGAQAADPASVAVTWTAADDAETYDVVIATDADLLDTVVTVGELAGTSYDVPAGTLAFCTTYYVGVTAVNDAGETMAANQPVAFTTRALADLTGPALDGVPDGVVSVADLNFYLGLWLDTDPAADLTGPALDGIPDGVVSVVDLNFFIAEWLSSPSTCP